MENPLVKLKDDIVGLFQAGLTALRNEFKADEAKLENKIKYELNQEVAMTTISRMITLRPQNAEKGLSAALEGVKVD